MIATHSHADHVGGLDKDIYDKFHIAHTIYGDKSDTGEFTEFMNAAAAEEDSEVHEDINECGCLQIARVVIRPDKM